MNENSNSNNNVNCTERMDNTKWNGFDFTGPCTAHHHQHFQMVDLLMQHCRRSICGLKPHALPHAPPQYQEEIRKPEEKPNEHK